MLRGCPFPGARDGASVQFYISTVIEDTRKICRNINFLVEMSDTRDLSGGRLTVKALTFLRKVSATSHNARLQITKATKNVRSE